MQSPVKISRIANVDIDAIEPLWMQLKEYQQQQTLNFEKHYLGLTFASRRAELLGKQRLALFVAENLIKPKQEPTGFCVASIQSGVGAIESLFVLPTERGNQIGTLLTQRALHWLKERQAAPIRLLVGQGNEGAIDYYAKLGFKIRASMLELIE